MRLRLVDIRLPQLRPFTAGWLRHPTRSSHTGLYLLLTHIGCLEIVWWVVTMGGLGSSLLASYLAITVVVESH